MKTERVRYAVTQAKKLQELADMSGRSTKWMVERGIELFIRQEWQFYMDEAIAVRKKIDGQGVHLEKRTP